MDDDLELESEGAGALASKSVRKNISLKLKTKAKSTSSLGKTKKKESKSLDRKSSAEGRDVRKKQRSPGLSGPAPQMVVKEMDWNHKIMIIGQKVQDPLLHLCEKCSLPILVYGRLSPCKHSFCLSCAEKGAGKCPRCGENVQRIERAPLGSVFVCSVGGSRYGISGCRRSYFSQRDLQSHIKRRHQREQGGGDSDGNEDAEAEANRVLFPPAGTGVPFFLPPPPRDGVPGGVIPRGLPQGDRPFGAVPIPGSMDARLFVPSVSIPRDPFYLEGARPQHPVVSGFPTQAPPQLTHLPQAGFPRPDQAAARFEELRGDTRAPRGMSGPSGIEDGFGQAIGPGAGFRFPVPDPDTRQGGSWPPRSEGFPERGPSVRGERDWIPPGRSERDWVQARGEGSWPPHGRPPPGDYRPMF